MKEFEFALKDLDEAMKLCPAEKDPQRLRDLYLEDQELDKRINDIMSNADSLKGKEFIDFIIGYLQGEGQ